MPITTFDQYIAAPKQQINISKVVYASVNAGIPHNILLIAGDIEPVMTAEGTAPTTGVIVTPSTLAGVPSITSTGNTQYLSKASFSNTVISCVKLHDLIYRAGTYSPSTTTTVTGPDVGARVDGTYYNTQLWVECVTPYTSGNLTLSVTYTSNLGSGRTTGTVAITSLSLVGTMFRLPLQAGDYGVKSIQSVAIIAGTVGTCNILITRPLWSGKVSAANAMGTTDGPIDTGMPIIYPGTCLFPILYSGSSATGYPQLALEIAG